MKLRRKDGVIIEVNPEAFIERGQDFDGFIKTMKKEGYEEI